MSISRERARHLVTAYDHSLEQQILERGSNLACRDEELWKQVEVLLRDEDAEETHCLGLDPLRVMEESLMVEAASTNATSSVSTGGVKARGGLQGLAKAFEVLEQAALNLYLGPWREEYKVVKMYSGMFTHYIKPVMSVAQIEKLFGLLGYQFCSTRREQLHLQSLRVSPAFLEELLRLSCAFYLARCECRLLLAALGKHSGEAQWELSVVRERQRGHNPQVALENTKRTQGGMESLDEESDVDLYTDEQENEGQSEVIVHEVSSHSPERGSLNRASPPVKTRSNGALSSSSSSSSSSLLSTRESVCISTFKCQLTNMSPLESDTAGSSSASKKQSRCPGEETFEKVDPSSPQMEVCGSVAEDNHLCNCLQSPLLYLEKCIKCNTLHNITSSQHCCPEGHQVLLQDGMKESTAVSNESRNHRALHASPTVTSSSAALSSLSLCDNPKAMRPSCHPISYHDCCDLAHLDPRLVCLSCRVFHSGSCREMELCQTITKHRVKELGVCSCGRACSRKPLVLCRYCGNEYCNDCWYRNPVVCTCGQTFDQSSSV